MDPLSPYEPTELERCALLAVANVVRSAEPLIFELWRSHDLTLAQLQCLRVLSRQPEQAGELAKKLSMSSTSLTRILERLESRQLVERTVDRHDRRRIWVRLTETGRQTVSSVASWYSSSLFSAIHHMPPQQLEQFAEVLNQYGQAVKDYEEIEAAQITPVSDELR